jgi:hypothetical protein
LTISTAFVWREGLVKLAGTIIGLLLGKGLSVERSPFAPFFLEDGEIDGRSLLFR